MGVCFPFSLLILGSRPRFQGYIGKTNVSPVITVIIVSLWVIQYWNGWILAVVICAHSVAKL